MWDTAANAADSVMSYMTKQTTGGKNAYCFNHNCTFLDCNPNTPLLFHLTI